MCHRPNKDSNTNNDDRDDPPFVCESEWAMILFCRIPFNHGVAVVVEGVGWAGHGLSLHPFDISVDDTYQH